MRSKGLSFMLFSTILNNQLNPFAHLREHLSKVNWVSIIEPPAFFSCIYSQDITDIAGQYALRVKICHTWK